MFRMLFLTILWTSSAFAQNELEVTTKVQEIFWQAQENHYRVTLKGHAAAYFTSVDNQKCLSESIKNKKNVYLKIDAQKMLILSCR